MNKPGIAFEANEFIDLEEVLNRNRPTFRGRHLWVLALFYGVGPDPKIDYEEMVLGPENLVSVTAVICFWCSATEADAREVCVKTRRVKPFRPTT